MGCIRQRDTWRTCWSRMKWWPRSWTEDVVVGRRTNSESLRAEHGEVHEISAFLLQLSCQLERLSRLLPTHAIEANGEEPPSFALSGVWLNNDSTDAMRATHAPTLVDQWDVRDGLLCSRDFAARSRQRHRFRQISVDGRCKDRYTRSAFSLFPTHAFFIIIEPPAIAKAALPNGSEASFFHVRGRWNGTIGLVTIGIRGMSGRSSANHPPAVSRELRQNSRVSRFWVGFVEYWNGDGGHDDGGRGPVRCRRWWWWLYKWKMAP
jgi:hypothetical protein